MLIKPLTHESFRRVVEDFCKKHDMSRREIGVNALNDAAFFLRLQKGKSPTLERIERIYDYMIEFEKKIEDDAANVSAKRNRT